MHKFNEIKKNVFLAGLFLALISMPAWSAWQDPKLSQLNEAPPIVLAQDATMTAKEAGPEAGKTPPFDLADPKHVAEGKILYMRTCAGYCHGGRGEGGRAPSFRTRDDLDPAYAYKTIVNGRVASDVMPVFGHTFTPEQVWELVSYLLFMGTQKD